MTRCFLKSKLHRVVVTQAELDYMGSITIDSELMEMAGLCEYEKVLVADIDTGNRFETYAIKGIAGSGTICINGAAANLSSPGNRVIILQFAWYDVKEIENKAVKPIVIVADDNNLNPRQLI